MISGPAGRDLHLVTVEELLNTRPPLCAGHGPVGSRCCRAPDHAPPCAALGTDRDGVPVVVTWYRPDTDSWPLTAGVRPEHEPGA